MSDTIQPKPCKLAPPGSSQNVHTCYTLQCGIYAQGVASCNLISDPAERQKCHDDLYAAYLQSVNVCDIY